MKSFMRTLLMGTAGLAALMVTAHLTKSEVIAQVRAALVQDVNNPAYQPLRAGGSFNVFTNDTFREEPVFTAPAGKRAVIEQISVRVETPAGSDEKVTASTTSTFIPVAFQGIFESGEGGPLRDVHIGLVQTRIYLSPGDSLSLRFQRSTGTAGGAVLLYGIQGYFVSLN